MITNIIFKNNILNIDSGFMFEGQSMENLDPRAIDWLNSRCESEKSRSRYIFAWKKVQEFCRARGKDINNIVNNYRAVKYQGEIKKEVFLDEWQDILGALSGWVKQFCPNTANNILSVTNSFLHFWKIPLEVDLPKHRYVVYHNRDITKEEVKRILFNSKARDRVLFLLLAESGMRSDTAVNLKYWQIKEDFEAKRLPMKILLPSAAVKDHVGDRWTFIGEDGFNELSDYLTERLPLKDEDYVFASEKPGKVKGEQFTAASISVKFNRIVQQLGIAESVGKAGKPKKIRLHGLRKYFRNNHGADSAYVNFWMGHSLGVDSHYISRNLEDHKKRYTEGYNALRVFKPDPESMGEVLQLIKEKEREIQELKEQNQKMQTDLQTLKSMAKMIPDDYVNAIVERIKQDPALVTAIIQGRDKLQSPDLKKNDKKTQNREQRKALNTKSAIDFPF